MLDITQNASVASAQASNTNLRQAPQPVENASAKNGFTLRTIPSDSGSVLTNIAKSRRLSPTEKSGLIRQLATFDTIKAEGIVRKNVLSNVQQVASFMEQTSKVSYKPTPIDQAVKQFERAQQAAQQQPQQTRTVERVEQNIENIVQQSRGVSVQEAIQTQTRQNANVRDSIEVNVNRQQNVPEIPSQGRAETQPVERNLPGQASEVSLALPGSASSEEIPLPGQADIEALEFALPGDGETAEVALPGQGTAEDIPVQAAPGLATEEVAVEEVPLEEVSAAAVEVDLPGADDASELSEGAVEAARVQTFV